MSEHIKVQMDFIPVAEALPEQGHVKKVLTRTGGMTEAYYDGHSLQWIHPFCGPLTSVTHWAHEPKIET